MAQYFHFRYLKCLVIFSAVNYSKAFDFWWPFCDAFFCLDHTQSAFLCKHVPPKRLPSLSLAHGNLPLPLILALVLGIVSPLKQLRTISWLWIQYIFRYYFKLHVFLKAFCPQWQNPSSRMWKERSDLEKQLQDNGDTDTPLQGDAENFLKVRQKELQ